MYKWQLAITMHWRVVAKIASVITLIVIINILARGFIDSLSFPVRPENEDAIHRTIMISMSLYSVLLAIPFVPGAEIGLLLMAALGPTIAMLVYLCTIAGLSLGFLAGRLIPTSVLVSIARGAGLERINAFLEEIEAMTQKERTNLLVSKAPKRFMPRLLRYRYLALAIAINAPGNMIIGGGGGIALLAGLSRVYSVPGYLFTIVIAVAPIPLAVIVLGSEFLPGFK